ncbi:MAG: patatin-like phospholipase family protein, partial [Burkholderiaceae bacterium]|nr:patatin-like phospholipase family protein [Burkholderiaceae bacterium]
SLGNAAHWIGALLFGWMIRSRPRSLFDNSPLADLLGRLIDLRRLQRCLDDGHLKALAITASSYTSGQHVTYYETRDAVTPWYRTQRLSSPTRIEIDHLLASSAIPFAFPAMPLHLDGRHEYFGDGSMRQTAPISPAIHLGADRILVIGAGQLQRGTARAEHTGSQYLYPSLAQVAGHAMASIFLDGLASDIERLTRVNRTVNMLADEHRQRSDLRNIDLLVIAPSQRLDTLATEHVQDLPRNIRMVLRMLGATDKRGAGLSSYLLFEKSYTRRLLALGREDAQAHRDDVLRFFDQG